MDNARNSSDKYAYVDLSNVPVVIRILKHTVKTPKLIPMYDRSIYVRFRIFH